MNTAHSTPAHSDDARVARTISEQLGGPFFAMVGARDLTYSSTALRFRFGRGPSSPANVAEVRLDPDDTYTLRFIAVRGVNVREVAAVSGVYVDALHSTFEAQTGLRTRL